jgi:CSLREA domain-containing protein
MTHRLPVLFRWLVTVAVATLAAVSMTQPVAAQERESDFGQLDLSRNGVINAADASLIIDAWQQLQQQNACLDVYAAYDVSGSGCIDVADIQQVLAGWGTSAATGQVQPDAPEFFAAQAQIITVNSTDDDVGAGYCEGSNKCTLRAALQKANTNGVPDEIRFDIRNSNGSCPSNTNPVQIHPTSTIDQPLRLDDANGAATTINGYSQCGASANTQPVSGNAQIRIEIVGKAKEVNPNRANSYKVPGIEILNRDNVVRGLAVYGWDYSIRVVGSKASDNHIEGNFIGTDVAQTFKLQSGDFYMTDGRTRKLEDGDGLRLESFARNTMVGGPEVSQRNIVAGAWDGIALEWRVVDTRIYNNYIGLKQNGTSPLGNAADGVDINLGSIGTRIGGNPTTGQPDAAYRNVISGNYSDGIEVSHSPYIITDTTPNQTYPTEDTYIIGNYIGTNARGELLNRSGTSLMGGNGSNGITLEDGVREVAIRGNVVSGNGDNGIRLWSRITDSEITDNKIGVAEDGVTPLPNGISLDPYQNYTRLRKGRHGIYLVGDSQRNKIINNVIANNKGYGILLNNGYTEYKCGNPSITSCPGAELERQATDFNEIRRNSIYNNGDWAYFAAIPMPPREFPYADPELDNGIKFKDQARDLPNLGIRPPAISAAYLNRVRGTATNSDGQACNGCVVEVFIADSNGVANARGQGRTFKGAAITDASGNFIVAVSGMSGGQLVTATTTQTFVLGTPAQSYGNTSEFSANVAVENRNDPNPGTPGPTPTPLPSPTPPPPTPYDAVYLPLIRK